MLLTVFNGGNDGVPASQLHEVTPGLLPLDFTTLEGRVTLGSLEAQPRCLIKRLRLRQTAVPGALL